MPFQHDIAGGQGNLIATSVQSPDYAAGSAGWQVRRDGSAEFNNLTIRGTFNGTDFVINSSGAFFYSGTPALGNLVFSIAPAAGTDTHGNAYQGPGAYAYGPNGSLAGLTDNGTFAELQLLPPGPVTQYTAHPAVLAYSVNPGAANEQMVGVLTSGQESGGDYGAVLAYAEPADASTPAAVGMAISSSAFGNGIFALLNKTSFTLFGIPLVITSQTIPAINLTPTPNSHVTNSPQIQAQALNSGAANEQLLTVLTSGKESSHDDAALQLFAASADNTVAARAVLEFGGAVQMQVDKTRVILTGQGSTPAQSSNNAVLYSTGSGGLNVVDGLDGQAYATQRRTLIVSSDTPLAASPSATTIFSTTVGVRSYLVEGMVIVSIVNAVQQLSINIAPPAGTGHASSMLSRAAALIATTDFNLNSLTGLGASGSLAVGSKYVLWFKTIMNVTSAGTCNIQFAGTNANDISVLANSYCSFEVV